MLASSNRSPSQYRFGGAASRAEPGTRRNRYRSWSLARTALEHHPRSASARVVRGIVAGTQRTRRERYACQRLHRLGRCSRCWWARPARVCSEHDPGSVGFRQRHRIAVRRITHGGQVFNTVSRGSRTVVLASCQPWHPSARHCPWSGSPPRDPIGRPRGVNTYVRNVIRPPAKAVGARSRPGATHGESILTRSSPISALLPNAVPHPRPCVRLSVHCVAAILPPGRSLSACPASPSPVPSACAQPLIHRGVRSCRVRSSMG